MMDASRLDRWLAHSAGRPMGIGHSPAGSGCPARLTTRTTALSPTSPTSRAARISHHYRTNSTASASARSGAGCARPMPSTYGWRAEPSVSTPRTPIFTWIATAPSVLTEPAPMEPTSSKPRSTSTCRRRAAASTTSRRASSSTATMTTSSSSPTCLSSRHARPSSPKSYSPCRPAIRATATPWSALRRLDISTHRQRTQHAGEELYRAYTSRDGITWERGGVWTHNLGTTARIGLVSMGGSGFTAHFDYVHVYELEH